MEETRIIQDHHWVSKLDLFLSISFEERGREAFGQSFAECCQRKKMVYSLDVNETILVKRVGRYLT